MPRTHRRSRRGGNALIEFSLLGVPVLFITVAIFSISINMWQYHTLAFATTRTARYVSVHGAGCTGSCTITVGNVAAFFENQSIALDRSRTTLTLKDSNGTVTSCSPVTSCESTSTQFPPAAYNAVGSDITINAYYTLTNPVAFFWPPDVNQPGSYPVGATSRQRIVF